MNDEYLKQFRKEPPPEFAEKLHAKLARQPQPRVAMPDFSRDGRKRSWRKHKEGDEMNGIFVLPLPGMRNYPLRGYLVVLVATVAAVLVSTVLILNRIGTVSNSLYWLAQEQENRALFERYITEVWNEGNTAQIVFMITAEHVHHDTTLPEPVVGVNALKAYVRKCRADLPDLTFEIDDLRTEGERMVADLRAVGEGVDVPLTASVRIVDGKLAETWFDVNALVTNAEVEAAWETIEAANLALAQKFVDFYQNLAEYIQDTETFNTRYVALLSSPYYEYGQWVTSKYGMALTPTDDLNYFRALIKAFPDLEITVENVMAAGNLVMLHYSSRGTFTDRWSPPGTSVALEPTGKEVTEQGVYIFRVRNGKIAEVWWYVSSPLYSVETAMMLKKRLGAGSVADEIYRLNNPE